MLNFNLKQTFGCVETQDLTRAHIVSASNSAGALAEDSSAAWVSGGAYQVGDRRHRVETGKVYDCVAAVTGSSTPPETDATHWKAMGPTNRMAALDLYRSTKMKGDTALTIVLRPDQFVDMVYLSGLTGESATISVTDGIGGPVVLPPTERRLDSYGVHDWQSVFLAPVVLQEYALFDAITLCADPVITISINHSGGVAALGKVVCGRFLGLGWTRYGVRFRIRPNDYTKWAPDGTYEYIERPPSVDIDGAVIVDTADKLLIGATLEKYRARPTLWLMHTGSGYDLLRHVAKFTGELVLDEYATGTLNVKLESMP